MRSKDGFFYYSEGRWFVSAPMIPWDVAVKHLNKALGRGKAKEMLRT